MPLIKRIETDMFVFSDDIDFMVNPVNLVSTPGAGLALEFRKRCPEYVEPYRAACRSQELRIGTVQVLDDLNQPWGMINFPTKRHYADISDKGDIIRGLEALRELLQTDQYRYCSIGMPMLGCGLGKQDYEVVYPLMIDHLGDLDATVFLSMSPERTEMRPRYLTIVGPPDYGSTQDEQHNIDGLIDAVMRHWGSSLGEYEGIVSGGLSGVDTYVCGADFNKNFENTFAYKRTLKTPLVVKPNRARNGVGSTLRQNNLLCEIGDDIILIKPKGHNNNRMSGMQMWLEADKLKREKDGHPPRRVAVFGDKTMTTVNEQVMIGVHTIEE